MSKKEKTVKFSSGDPLVRLISAVQDTAGADVADRVAAAVGDLTPEQADKIEADWLAELKDFAPRAYKRVTGDVTIADYRSLPTFDDDDDDFELPTDLDFGAIGAEGSDEPSMKGGRAPRKKPAAKKPAAKKPAAKKPAAKKPAAKKK